MAYKQVMGFLHCAEHIGTRRNVIMHLDVMLYHSVQESELMVLPAKWYENAYPKMAKLAHLLKNVEEADGRLINVKDSTIITDDVMEHKMHTFKSLVTAFIGSPEVQQKLKKNVRISSMESNSRPPVCFSQSSERHPIILNSLTQVSDFLNISAQRRKLVRQTICPQVTQQRIWTGALVEILNGLKYDLDIFDSQYPSGVTKMGPQIISSCLKFLDDTAITCDPESASWMKLAPTKNADSSNSQKWEDVLEMFTDLIKCLSSESRLLLHVRKLEVMKEGLSQIKDVSVDRSLGYRDARHQEILLQKKLSKTLSHSSPCLFTLLMYYLYGRVRDIEVDVCGGIHGHADGKTFYLCMGKILTSDQESIFWNGVKQLDRVLGLLKFVWETAGTKGVLELQGHLWCVGAEDKIFTYRGNTFFLHGINMRT